MVHKKKVWNITEAALKRFQKGLNADPNDKILKDVYPDMIHEFKTIIKQVYDAV